ncbi:MAG TPA: AzlD domain-containing protein [Pseudolabrys sp.]|nr:AzlD domain-containing protein [Pseudolabrys sp.]
MPTELGQTAYFWLTIAAMTAVNYAIRSGGFILMGYVPLTPRVRSILNALPGAVVVAIVLPLMVRGGLPAWAAVLVALAMMAWRRNDLLAVVCGMGTAALLRAF